MRIYARFAETTVGKDIKRRRQQKADFAELKLIKAKITIKICRQGIMKRKEV